MLKKAAKINIGSRHKYLYRYKSGTHMHTYIGWLKVVVGNKGKEDAFYITWKRNQLTANKWERIIQVNQWLNMASFC